MALEQTGRGVPLTGEEGAAYREVRVSQERYLLMPSAGASEPRKVPGCNSVVYAPADNGPIRAVVYSEHGYELRLCINGLVALAAHVLNHSGSDAVEIGASGMIFKFHAVGGQVALSVASVVRPELFSAFDIAAVRGGFRASFVTQHALFETAELDGASLQALKAQADRSIGTGANLHLFERKQANRIAARTLANGRDEEALSSGAGAILIAALAQRLWNWTGTITYRDGARFQWDGSMLRFPACDFGGDGPPRSGG